jgi:NAD(P)-dependent dehydrogenase (short-subunit alcohol dehydrogenase family)
MGGSLTMPAMGPYTMSKHALEAYAGCLRQELAPHGVAVSIVQPGAVATEIGANGRTANLARLRATPAPFDAVALALAQSLENPVAPDPAAPESADNRRFAPPEAVAAVVLQALEAAVPQARYLVGTAWEGERVIQALLARLVDAATSPGPALDEEALVARLRQAWLDRLA